MEARIDTDKLDLPDSPEIQDIRVEHTGSTDDPAARISVIVSDETDESKLRWPETKSIEREIKRYFYDIRPETTPVVVFRKRSEFDEEEGESG